MKRCLLLLLLLLPRIAPAQVDPAPAAQFVRQYAGHYRVSPELVTAVIADSVALARMILDRIVR